jgi:hypothetical protein
MAAFTAKDPNDRAAFDAHMRKVRTSPENLVRAVTLDKEFVGTVGSFIIDGETEVTYWIDRRYWGRGIATRALELLLEIETTRPLHARAASDNPGSLRVLAKVGFVPIGTRWRSRTHVGMRSRRRFCCSRVAFALTLRCRLWALLRPGTSLRYAPGLVRAFAGAAGRHPLLRRPTIAPLLGLKQLRLRRPATGASLRPSLCARPTFASLLGRPLRYGLRHAHAQFLRLAVQLPMARTAQPLTARTSSPSRDRPSPHDARRDLHRQHVLVPSAAINLAHLTPDRAALLLVLILTPAPRTAARCSPPPRRTARPPHRSSVPWRASPWSGTARRTPRPAA